MLKKLKNLKLKRNFNSKEKVDIAVGKVKTALWLFKEAHEEIEKANEVLKEAMDEDSRKIIELQANSDRALAEFQMNNKLKEKLEEFLK